MSDNAALEQTREQADHGRHVPATKVAKWTYSLGSGVLDQILYVVAEFARGKPILRALIFTLAVGLTVILALVWIGVFKGVSGFSGLVSPIFLFVLPSLLRMAIYSGDDFKVVFITQEARKKEQVAEEKFDQSHSPVDAVRLDEARLNTYYEINQAQARSIFRWAVSMMVMGFSTIIAGIWIFYFKQGKADVFMTSLITAAGMTSNLISGLFLYLHHKTQERSYQYYEELADLQRVRVAIEVANANMSEGQRSLAVQSMITHLLDRRVQTPAKPKRNPRTKSLEQ